MILLRSNVPLKLETTLEKGKKIGTLTHIILVAHSHKSLLNGSDRKLMALFPCSQNTSLTWKKFGKLDQRTVKHTILTESLHTIHRECGRS